MSRIEIEDFQQSVEEHVDSLRPGEKIVLCRDGSLIAEVRTPPQQRTKTRELGLAKGQIVVTDEFFEPLPDEILEIFEGRDANDA